MRRFLVLLAAGGFLSTLASAQDSQPAQDSSAPQEQSLGDAARQAKLKKQQKAAQAKAKEAASQESIGDGTTAAPEAKKTRVLSNEDDSMAPASAPVTSTHAKSATEDPKSDKGDRDAQAESWKSQISAAKTAIAALEEEIKSTGDSIQFAGANCVANCAQWNEHQQQKQQEVETMKSQLEQQKKQLEEMQETARKQGFGSSVYDP